LQFAESNLTERMRSSLGGSHPSRWNLHPAHVELLTKTLRAGFARMSVTAEQRAVIHEICLAPERAWSAPEDFLIAFKLAVADAASAAKIPPGPERNELLSRLVSVYIEEFYRTEKPIKENRSDQGAQELRTGL
jgi:hypothetical protein